MTAIPAPTVSQVTEINFLQAQFHTEIDKHKSSQREYQKLITMDNQLNTQLNENGMVKEELDLVKSDAAVVYKLSGPVLLRQSLVEAKENVERRIKFIENELERNKDLLAKAKDKLSQERNTITQLESKIQGLMSQAGMS